MAGIFIGAAFPERWGLEYSGTLALLALTCSLVTNRMRALAAVTTGFVALVAVGLPYRLNIVAAIVVGVGICMLLERDPERRRGDAA